MRSKIFFILSIVLMTFSFACQKKSDSTYTNEGNKEKSDKLESKVNPSGLSLKSSTDSLAERLMNDFGLVVLSTEQMGNTQFPSFSDYQSASDHITLMRQRLNQSISGSTTMSSGPSIESMRTSQKDYLLPPDCSSAGTYHSSLGGSGGFFSNFNVYFNNSASGVSSASVYTSGTPIGWSWSQVATSFSGSSYSGCVGGYITNGLQIGNITIGWQQAYHFNFSFNGSTCSLSYSQGSGPC